MFSWEFSGCRFKLAPFLDGDGEKGALIVLVSYAYVKGFPWVLPVHVEGFHMSRSANFV